VCLDAALSVARALCVSHLQVQALQQQLDLARTKGAQALAQVGDAASAAGEAERAEAAAKATEHAAALAAERVRLLNLSVREVERQVKGIALLPAARSHLLAAVFSSAARPCATARSIRMHPHVRMCVQACTSACMRGTLTLPRSLADLLEIRKSAETISRAAAKIVDRVPQIVQNLRSSVDQLDEINKKNHLRIGTSASDCGRG
jgi:hypothetical protein